MIAFNTPVLAVSPIAQDVRNGLSESPKQLPPKLFYDAEGSRLFEQITALPEYYPTRTERAIFEVSAAEIVTQAGENLTLVELGAGSASKTTVLIKALVRRQLRVMFYPIDVSVAALQDAVSTLEESFPTVRVRPIAADYSMGLPQLKTVSGRKLVLFIGSTIGNFEPPEAVRFLTQIRASLKPGDSLLLGCDLIKDPAVLHAAYNDAQGVTAEFNKNILARINRELGGQFDLDAFEHVAFWNSRKSRIEMHLESKREQSVMVRDLGEEFLFKAGERIHTENSYKFTLPAISHLFRRSGLRLEKHWTDKNEWFCVAMGRAI
jgi:dimethylhistidine N-methyltransferase